jgi:L-fuculose-phosphate aldolase
MTINRAGAGIKSPERLARADVVATAMEVSRRGLSPGRSGNVSRRWKKGLLITPSGVPYDELGPSHVVYVDQNGTPAKGALRPSSEWQLHRAIYSTRPDVQAVVHTHSMHAVVMACARRSIPAFHYMVAAAGGKDIPCVPYATFGSEELAQSVAGGLKDRDACLLANHGQVAVGETLSAAVELAAEVETLAEQYLKVLMLGAPHVLSDAEMDKVLQRFRTYGQKAQNS